MKSELTYYDYWTMGAYNIKQKFVYNYIAVFCCKFNIFLQNLFHADIDPARFVTKLKDATVEEGEKVTFEVTFAGNPKPEIKWLENKQFDSVGLFLKIKQA